MTLNRYALRPARVQNRFVLSGSALMRFGLGLGTVVLGYLGVQFVLGLAVPPQERVAIASFQPAPDVQLQAEPPQVWLSPQFNPGALPPFARHDFVEGQVLPRLSRPLPPLPPRTSPQPEDVADALPADADQMVPQMAQSPQALASRIPAQPLTPNAGLEPPERTTDDATADLASPQAVAVHRAPTRSPRPQARPQLATALASVTTADDLATGDEVAHLALARSRTPRPRPERVTRLASVVLASARAPRAATTTVVPQARSPLEVPPLNRAIARADQCDSVLTRDIPRRARRADGGDGVIQRLTSVSGSARDAAVLDEVLHGNIPDFLRDLVPVTFTGTAANGQETRITICVMPDYLAVGSDRDFVRVPLGLPAASRVAERFDMVLPTTRMVDAIYAQASVHLSPAPMQPGAQMASTNYFLRHNATVETQRRQAGGQLGQLVSGHKKDLVLTNRLNRNPGRVAIYGWHRRSGAPIQPLSTVHGAQYADYSHGIRLVSRRAYVNGRPIDLGDVLSDSRLAGLVSSEGTITNRQMLASLR